MTWLKPHSHSPNIRTLHMNKIKVTTACVFVGAVDINLKMNYRSTPHVIKLVLTTNTFFILSGAYLQSIYFPQCEWYFRVRQAIILRWSCGFHIFTYKNAIQCQRSRRVIHRSCIMDIKSVSKWLFSVIAKEAMPCVHQQNTLYCNCVYLDAGNEMRHARK